MSHVPACADRMKQQSDFLNEYTTQWPDYCKACGGIGSVFWWKTPGDSCHGQVMMSDGCEGCSLTDKCPRCATKMDWEEDMPTCSQCGWQNAEDGAPAEPECICPPDLDF